MAYKLVAASQIMKLLFCGTTNISQFDLGAKNGVLHEEYVLLACYNIANHDVMISPNIHEDFHAIQLEFHLRNQAHKPTVII